MIRKLIFKIVKWYCDRIDYKVLFIRKDNCNVSSKENIQLKKLETMHKNRKSIDEQQKSTYSFFKKIRKLFYNNIFKKLWRK